MPRHQFLLGRVGRLGDAIEIVEDRTEISNSADAGLETHRRLTGLDARKAQDAFFRFSGAPVVVGLLVGTTGDAIAPATTAILIDQHHAVFLALVVRARRTGADACRIEAVVTDARQIHHERILELQQRMPRRGGHVAEVVVPAPGALLVRAGAVVFPVDAVGEIDVLLTGDHRLRARDRLRELGRFLGMQVLVGEGERPLAVVIVHLRKHGVVEQADHLPKPRGLVELRLVRAGIFLPAAAILVLVFPFPGIADTRFGLDVVPEHVFRAFAVGPDVLAGDGAGLTTQALVQVEDHRHLLLDTHDQAPPTLSCDSW